MVKNFKGKPLLGEIPPEESVSSGPVLIQPRMEDSMEKYIASQVFNHAYHIIHSCKKYFRIDNLIQLSNGLSITFCHYVMLFELLWPKNSDNNTIALYIDLFLINYLFFVFFLFGQ